VLLLLHFHQLVCFVLASVILLVTSFLLLGQLPEVLLVALVMEEDQVRLGDLKVLHLVERRWI
jgi:hypothetical protein